MAVLIDEPSLTRWIFTTIGLDGDGTVRLNIGQGGAGPTDSQAAGQSSTYKVFSMLLK